MSRTAWCPSSRPVPVRLLHPVALTRHLSLIQPTMATFTLTLLETTPDLRRRFSVDRRVRIVRPSAPQPPTNPPPRLTRDSECHCNLALTKSRCSPRSLCRRLPSQRLPSAWRRHRHSCARTADLPTSWPLGAPSSAPNAAPSSRLSPPSFVPNAVQRRGDQ